MNYNCEITLQAERCLLNIRAFIHYNLVRVHFHYFISIELPDHLLCGSYVRSLCFYLIFLLIYTHFPD